jgi:hypothetical protein
MIVQLDFYVGGVCAHGSWVWRCGLGFATDAIGRRIAGLLVASDWAAFVVFFIAEFVIANQFSHSLPQKSTS